MLLVVGAAAMRQVAEDAVALSAAQEEWYPDLRKEVEEVAKKFPGEERHYLKEAVMKAIHRGLDLDLISWRMEQMHEELVRLKGEVEEVAKKKFPWEERHYRHYLIEAVMKAKDHGTLYEGREGRRDLMTAMEQMSEDLRLVIKNADKFQRKNQHRLREAVINAWVNAWQYKKKSREETERYLLAAMQQMQQEFEVLFDEVERVAKEHFTWKEQHRLIEAVMNAWEKGELEHDLNRWRMSSGTFEFRYLHNYLLKTMQRLRELPVAASAVKFCSELFREAHSEAKARADYLEKSGRSRLRDREGTEAEEALRQADMDLSQSAPWICHKVLTGELGADEPEWAKEAAKSSQPKDQHSKPQHLKRGRLQKVDATETAWKVSLNNVCKDECVELVKEMRKETRRIFKDVDSPKKPPSYEEVCAKRVVQKVEAEILGCCAEKCGWNGRACMLWPFLSRTEKGQWEAECCTEFNILKRSSRAIMCDATLTGNEKKKVIRDGQQNRPEHRRMIGQDPVLKGTSFLQSEDTNGPSPPPGNTPIPQYEGTCPDPLNLGKELSKLEDEWKTTNYQEAKANFKNLPLCGTPPKPLIGTCKAFLPQGVNGGYACYEACLGPVDDLKFTGLKDTVPESVSQLLFVHKSISGE